MTTETSPLLGNETVIRTMPSGVAVLGRAQFLPGYCILSASVESAERLSDLPKRDRLRFLSDMEMLGEAVELVCRRRDPAFRRINLEIQGNLSPTLHAHVWPRYDWELPSRVIRQVGRYPLRMWHDPETALSSAHIDLRDELRDEVARLIG